ncbi:MAG TPA: HDOD domain-containing protein [Thermodesulfobacteriaceae bacterium]|nr:HDOD domain-containing protein [Thermodesulfobacteriaceae bacterium]
MLNFWLKRINNPKKELNRLLKGYELPSFPDAVMKVLALLRNQDSSMQEISKYLQMDPGIHVCILKTVNSAAFGLAARVSNIHHAVTLLGRSRLESLVLAFAVKSVLPSVDIPCLNMRKFWVTAARRATLAGIVARLAHPATQVESFAAGLLQDMAIPVISSLNRNGYCSVIDEWDTDGRVRPDILERNIFGYDHQIIGGLMAEQWELPAYLVASISEHHCLDRKTQVEPAVKLVSCFRYGNNTDDMGTFMDTCTEELGLDPDMLKELTESAFEEAEGLSRVFV